MILLVGAPRRLIVGIGLSRLRRRGGNGKEIKVKTAVHARFSSCRYCNKNIIHEKGTKFL